MIHEHYVFSEKRVAREPRRRGERRKENIGRWKTRISEDLYHLGIWNDNVVEQRGLCKEEVDAARAAVEATRKVFNGKEEATAYLQGLFNDGVLPPTAVAFLKDANRRLKKDRRYLVSEYGERRACDKPSKEEVARRQAEYDRKEAERLADTKARRQQGEEMDEAHDSVRVVRLAKKIAAEAADDCFNAKHNTSANAAVWKLRARYCQAAASIISTDHLGRNY